MHKTRAEARAFFLDAAMDLKKREGVRYIVCPSPSLLDASATAASGTAFEIFAQNCAWEDSGAFTGEVSPAQLRDLDVTGTLVGHSERRTLFGDTDETCGKRAAKALACGLEVIYCVGETLGEREAGITQQVLAKQIKAFLTSCGEAVKKGAKVMIAYEPVWAIGTGKVATPAQAQEAHGFIDILLQAGGLKLPILYGGSVKPDNFGELSRLPDVSGGLVGGASLKPADYVALARCL